MRRVIALAAVCMTTTACRNGKTPVELTADPQLTLSADSVVVDVGATTSVSATVRNSSAAAQFVSRDQTVATVNASGVVSGIGVGSTYVVATLANRTDVRDSVRVRVQTSFVEVCPNARPDFGGPATAADRALFAYDATAPLNLKKTVDSIANGVEFNSISFDSPAGGSVTGIMYRPLVGSGQRPGVVVMHPSFGPSAPAKGARLTQYEMLGHAERGAVAIGIDAPYVRAGSTVNPPRLSTLDRPEHIQLIKDLQRAVDVLLAQGNVDPARIGFSGYSFGGMIGVGFAGIERRLKAAVIAAGFGGPVTGATNANTVQALSSVSCALRRTWFEQNIPIEPIRFISGASPVALLFQIARFDTFVLPADAQAAYDAASSPKEVVYFDSGHAFPVQAMEGRIDWLAKQLAKAP